MLLFRQKQVNDHGTNLVSLAKFWLPRSLETRFAVRKVAPNSEETGSDKSQTEFIRDKLKEVASYDPEDGRHTWQSTPVPAF